MTDLLAPQPPGIPLPLPSAFSAPYWEACDRGELVFRRCVACGTALADAPRVCWHCRGRDLSWEVSTGRGHLYSWTVVWRPQTPSFTVPYAPAIVRLEEGIHVVSALVGCRPDELAQDLALEVVFHPAGEGRLLPYFRPAGA